MDKQYRYKTRFQAFAKAVTVDDENKKLATASLRDLAKVFNSDVVRKIDDNPDLLFIASNLILCDHINLNGDGVRKSDILEIYNNFKLKPIDLQHDREQLRGAIYDVGFSVFPTNKIITAEEALKSNEPIQMVIGGFLWKLIDPRLCLFLIEASDEKSENYGLISTSFELLFDNYDICIGRNGNTDINQAELIKSDNPLYEHYSKMLKCNGGNGISGNDIIGRILKDGILPVGAGLVTKPASGLKGILTMEKNNKDKIEENVVQESTKEWLRNAPESGVGYHICDVEMEDGSIHEKVAIINCSIVPKEIDAKKIKSVKLIKNDIKLEPSSVNANINHNNKLDSNMPIKINDLKELDAHWPELVKMESSASVREFIESELTKLSEAFSKQLKEKEDLIHTVEASKADADKKVLELQEAVEKLNKHVEEMGAAEHLKQCAEKFNERMANIDNTFDLDEDDRAMLAKDIKEMPCESDDMYAAFMDKHKKLMKEKTKEFKQKQQEKANAAKAELEDKLLKAGLKATFDEKTLNLKEVVASVVETKGQSTVPNTVVPATNESLTDQFKRVFGDGLTVGGKKANEITKKE